MPPDPRDTALLELVRSMIARPEFLLPLAAADKQYRDHYYRLNAAALLEDLFFDALGNFVRQTQPALVMQRAPSGGLEWDYSLDDWRVSHKVLGQTGKVAVHWDALVQNTNTWSATTSMMLVLSRSDPAIWRVTDGSTEFRVAPVAPSSSLVGGRRALLSRWNSDLFVGVLEVLDSVEIEPDTPDLSAVLSFDRVWRSVADTVANHGSAARIEILLTQAVSANPPIGAQLTPQDLTLPAGVYLIPASYIQNTPVSTNNRSGKLLSKDVIVHAMQTAINEGLFVRMPLWYRCYAGLRPPDLYAAQRSEYDALFSARFAQSVV